MADSSADSSASFFRRHLEGWKGYWAERLSIVDNYRPFLNRNKPLPKWSASDVEEFIASDPVYGPTVCISQILFRFWIIWVLFSVFSPGFPLFLSLIASDFPGSNFFLDCCLCSEFTRYHSRPFFVGLIIFGFSFDLCFLDFYFCY